MSVRIEWMKSSRASKTLGWDGLDDVAGDNVLLQLCDEALVALLADIRDGFLLQHNEGLGDFGGCGGQNELCQSSSF